MKLFAESKLTNIKTIERMRRKLQEAHPELRGKLYKNKDTSTAQDWKTVADLIKSI